jgi:hypothetical protein
LLALTYHDRSIEAPAVWSNRTACWCANPLLYVIAWGRGRNGARLFHAGVPTAGTVAAREASKPGVPIRRRG